MTFAGKNLEHKFLDDALPNPSSLSRALVCNSAGGIGSKAAVGDSTGNLPNTHQEQGFPAECPEADFLDILFKL